MKKKILITLLSLVIATIMVPHQVFAETTQNLQSETSQKDQINSDETFGITPNVEGVETSPIKVNEADDDYLSFTAIDGAVTIQMTEEKPLALVYSFNKQEWRNFILGEGEGVTVPENQKMYLKLKDDADPEYPADTYHVDTFKMTAVDEGATVEAGGNIMSLVSHDLTSADTIEEDGGFTGLFQDVTILKTPPKLPATKLAPFCYFGMFQNAGITSAPELPAEELKEACYNQMFQNTKITSAPNLPAEELVEYCYFGMFLNCNSLETPPKMLAQKLAFECCAQMFSGCIKLKSAPELFATELETGCYIQMFYDCSSINEIIVHFEEWKDPITDYATIDWLEGVADVGTFKCPASLEEKKEQHYIPKEWTVNKFSNITLPKNLQHGTVSATVDGEAVEVAYIGDTVTLNYEATDPGWEVSEWSIDGVPITGTSFEMPNHDVVIGAYESQASYTITIVPAEHGNITISPEQETYEEDTLITLAYESIEGYEANTWVIQEPGFPPFTITDNHFKIGDSDITVQAIETQIDYAITIEGPQHGSTTAEVDGAATTTAHFGDKVSLNTSMEPGYELKKYIVTEVEGGAIPVDDEGTFTMPLSDVNVQVEEAAIQPPVPIDNPTIEEISATGDNATCEIMLIAIASFALAVVLLRNKQ